MRVNNRLSILSFVLRAFLAVLSAFMLLVVCLYGLILKLIVGLYMGFVRNLSFFGLALLRSPAAFPVTRPGLSRFPVQLSGLAYSLSDIGIIGSASRADNILPF